MLDPHKLNLLLQLQELGTMRAVAEETFQSVSHVSQQLASLEKSIGRPLLEKEGRSVRLTPLGEEVVRLSLPILGGLRQLEVYAKNKSGEIQGSIRIASFSSAITPILLPTISRITQSHPKLRIQLVEMEPHKSLRLLRAGHFELAITAGFGDSTANIEGLIERKLLTDHLCAVLPANHPFANRNALNLSDLAQEEWIHEPQGTTLANYLFGISGIAGFQPRSVAVLDSYSEIMSAVANGLGITVLPSLATRNHLQTGTVALPINGAANRTVSIALNRPASNDPIISYIVEELERTCSDFWID